MNELLSNFSDKLRKVRKHLTAPIACCCTEGIKCPVCMALAELPDQDREDWERKTRALGNAIISSPDYGRTWEFRAAPKFIEAFVRHLREDLIDAPDGYPARAMVMRMLTLEAERDAAVIKLEETVTLNDFKRVEKQRDELTAALKRHGKQIADLPCFCRGPKTTLREHDGFHVSECATTRLLLRRIEKEKEKKP